MTDNSVAPPTIDQLINRVLIEMELYGPDSPEYPTMLAYLERLNDMKAQTRRKRISSDTLAICGANLVGILIMVSYEHAHVMTSRAKDFLLKTPVTTL